jgi:hypothetical protein
MAIEQHRDSETEDRGAPPAYVQIGTDEVFEALGELHFAASEMTHLSGKENFRLDHVIERVSQIDRKIAPHLQALWKQCTRGTSGPACERFSQSGKRVATQLTQLYLACIRQLEQGGCSASLPDTQLYVCAMRAIRGLFKWLWLRYEVPQQRLWTAATYLYQRAELANLHQVQEVICERTGDISTVEREYQAIRFIDWIGPSTLTAAELDELDRTVADALAHDMPRTPGAGMHAAEEAGAMQPQQLLERLAAHEGEWSIHDTVRLISRYAREGQLRQHRRDAARQPIPRPGLMLCNIASIAEGDSSLPARMPGARAGRPDYRECFVHNQAHDSCQILLRNSGNCSMQVGALIAVASAPARTPMLGVIRALTRDEDDNWEAEVSLMPDGLAPSPEQSASSPLSVESRRKLIQEFHRKLAETDGSRNR